MRCVAAAHAARTRRASCGCGARRTRPAAARARARARGRCRWPRSGTPEPRGERGQRAVARAVVALRRGAAARRAGARGPKAAQQPRAASARRARPWSRAARSGRRAPRRARSTSSSGTRGRQARAAAPVARVRVRARDDPAEVAPARARRDEQRDVASRVPRRLATACAASVGESRPPRRGSPAARAPCAACANSIEPETRVVVGQRERLVPELDRRGHASSSGSEAPSRNEKAEWQWSSTYGHEHMFASGEDGRARLRTPPPPAARAVAYGSGRWTWSVAALSWSRSSERSSTWEPAARARWGCWAKTGIGKSALLDEVAAAAGRAGLVVLTGRAAEQESEVPFGLVIDALDEHVATWSPARVAAVSPEVAAVLPSAGATADGTGGMAMAPGERFQFHRALRAVLELLGGQQPFALLLDDLHWADEASVELVVHLLRRTPRVAAPARVRAAAGRSGGAARSTPRAARRVRGAAAGPARRRGRSAPARDALSGRPARALAREAAGNPLFLHELAHRPRRRPAPADHGASPPSITRSPASPDGPQRSSGAPPSRAILRSGARRHRGRPRAAEARRCSTVVAAGLVHPARRARRSRSATRWSGAPSTTGASRLAAGRPRARGGRRSSAAVRRRRRTGLPRRALRAARRRGGGRGCSGGRGAVGDQQVAGDAAHWYGGALRLCRTSERKRAHGCSRAGARARPAGR